MFSAQATGKAYAVIAALLACSPATAAQICDYQPPAHMRKAPTVNYAIVELPLAALKKQCRIKHAKLLGCSQPTFNASLAPIWIIYVKAEVQEPHRGCIISHEMGHLPPNNWRHN